MVIETLESQNGQEVVRMKHYHVLIGLLLVIVLFMGHVLRKRTKEVQSLTEALNRLEAIQGLSKVVDERGEALNRAAIARDWDKAEGSIDVAVSGVTAGPIWELEPAEDTLDRAITPCQAGKDDPDIWYDTTHDEFGMVVRTYKELEQ